MACGGHMTSLISSPCAAEVGEGPTHWDLGLHPSDARDMCEGVMGGGEGSSPDHPGNPGHPGRLLYYGRAELKQSDHRLAAVWLPLTTM